MLYPNVGSEIARRNEFLNRSDHCLSNISKCCVIPVLTVYAYPFDDLMFHQIDVSVKICQPSSIRYKKAVKGCLMLFILKDLSSDNMTFTVK